MCLHGHGHASFFLFFSPFFPLFFHFFPFFSLFFLLFFLTDQSNNCLNKTLLFSFQAFVSLFRCFSTLQLSGGGLHQVCASGSLELSTLFLACLLYTTHIKTCTVLLLLLTIPMYFTTLSIAQKLAHTISCSNCLYPCRVSYCLLQKIFTVNQLTAQFLAFSCTGVSSLGHRRNYELMSSTYQFFSSFFPVFHWIEKWRRCRRTL